MSSLVILAASVFQMSCG